MTERREAALEIVRGRLEACESFTLTCSRPSIQDTSPEAVKAEEEDGWVRRKPGPVASIMIELNYDD